MDNIIKQIIEIDRIACEKTKEAEDRKFEELDKLDSLKSNIIKNWDLNNKSTIERIKHQQLELLNSDIAKINIDKDKKVSQIKEMYSKYNEQWSKTIFDNIINKADN